MVNKVSVFTGMVQGIQDNWACAAEMVPQNRARARKERMIVRWCYGGVVLWYSDP
jgi:hypothetical protein